MEQQRPQSWRRMAGSMLIVARHSRRPQAAGRSSCRCGRDGWVGQASCVAAALSGSCPSRQLPDLAKRTFVSPPAPLVDTSVRSRRGDLIGVEKLRQANLNGLDQSRRLIPGLPHPSFRHGEQPAPAEAVLTASKAVVSHHTRLPTLNRVGQAPPSRGDSDAGLLA